MAKQNQSNLPDGVSAEDVAQWKEKYGALKLIECIDKSDPGKKFKAVFRVEMPNKTVAAAIRFADKDPYNTCKVLVHDCFLGGDTIIKEKPTYITQAGGILAEYLDDCEVKAQDL